MKIRDGRLCLDIPEDCPESGSIYDGVHDCPECGRPFRDEEWTNSHAGDAWGGIASYTCPDCEKQTVTVYY